MPSFFHRAIQTTLPMPLPPYKPPLTYLSAGVSRNAGRVKAWAVATRAKKESVLILFVGGYTTREEA